MISAVLLNWQREEGIREICARLSAHDLVGEIIVWNNNPAVHLEIALEKARVINCSEDFGLFTRFAAASLARNACILYHDDDLVVADETLEELYGHWCRRPGLCHALFGRCFGPRGEYNTRVVYGPVEMVLTRYAMVHRRVCVHALSKTPAFADLPGVPVGNGEDIILSYAAMDLSGGLNRAYNRSLIDLGQDENVSIHRRYPGHVEHRSRVIRRCRRVFRTRWPLTKRRVYDRWLLWRRRVERRMPAAMNRVPAGH